MLPDHASAIKTRAGNASSDLVEDRHRSGSLETVARARVEADRSVFAIIDQMGTGYIGQAPDHGAGSACRARSSRISWTKVTTAGRGRCSFEEFAAFVRSKETRDHEERVVDPGDEDLADQRFSVEAVRRTGDSRRVGPTLARRFGRRAWSACCSTWMTRRSSQRAISAT